MTPFNILLDAKVHTSHDAGSIDLVLASIVPAGQQLVVEFVSTSCQMSPDQHPTVTIVIVNNIGSEIVQHYAVMHSQVKDSTGAVYTSADPMHFRLTPDLTLRAVIGRPAANTGKAHGFFGISGYIE